MARPREFDETTVLDAIKDVFWQKGYEGTSYADLIAASGLHKGSLYAAFGDKRALYLKALKAYDDHEVTAAVTLLESATKSRQQSNLSPIESLLNAVIDAVAIQNDRRGCLLCNAAIDQAPHNIEVGNMVSSGLSRMKAAFIKALNRSAFPDADTTASHVNAVYFGMRVMAKSGAPVQMMQETRDSLVDMLKAKLTQPNTGQTEIECN